jgi:hypothetical protein
MSKDFLGTYLFYFIDSAQHLDYSCNISTTVERTHILWHRYKPAIEYCHTSFFTACYRWKDQSNDTNIQQTYYFNVVEEENQANVTINRSQIYINTSVLKTMRKRASAIVKG